MESFLLDTCYRYIIPTGRPCRAKHFPLHFPRCIDALPRKPHIAQPGLIDAIQYLHQLGAFLPRFVLVKKVKLSYAIRREIIKRDTGLHIAPTIQPDAIERTHRNFNNVSRILGRESKFFPCTITVINFVNSMRLCSGSVALVI
ncbi:Uncharacterised protein [Yersinia frederiksenii]|nr:Uncharacterised protein [Yersinia frederiksenii]